MSKRMTRVLSLILTLIMFVSVSTPAFAWGGGDLGSGWDREIGEDEIRDFDEPVVEEEETLDYFHALDEESLLEVTVEAPMGALPTLAELRAEPVEIEDVREAVESVVDGKANILVAMDISFWMNGVEIEPEEPVNVKISAPELADKTNLTLVHIPDAAEPETIDLIDDEDLGFALGTTEIAFKANSFSVYVVVDDGSTDDEARATVNFWADTAKTKNRATVYVKNSDTLAELKDIVYDPGVGNLGTGEIFRGWTTDPNYTRDTEALTVEDIREELEAKTITEGDVVDYYAMIFKIYSISFQDEFHATIKTEKIYIRADGEAPSYTIKENYVPADPNKKFDGWYASGNVSPVKASYDVDDVVTVSGNVVFSVNAPEGAWLSFNENGKGASYTPPQFVPKNSNTQPVDPPSRLGYTFGGWYTDKDCTSGNEFTFGSTLDQRLDVYAKWNPNPTAPYTVIIWQQQTTGNKYDFVRSIPLTGNSNTNVNSVAQRGTGNDAYARINGTDYQYTGFHLASFDSPVEIDPTGTSVVNVYYDRNEYTLTFRAPDPATGTEGQQKRVYTFNSNGTLSSHNYYYHEGKWYSGRSGNNYWGYTYTGEITIPVYASNSFKDVKTIKARYGAVISGEFPIVGNNGVTYNSGERWKPQSNSVGFNKVMLEVVTMPAGDVTFTVDAPQRPLKTMNYYVEALPGASGTTTAPTLYKGTNNQRVNPGSTRFVLDFTLNARYNGVTVEDLLDLDGFELLGVDSEMNDDGYYIWSTSQDGTVNIYYTRNKYQIVYNDGKYVNGNGTAITETIRKDIGESDEIYYGANLADQDGVFKPTVSGYVLEGWYLDDACSGDKFDFANTTMPKGGIQLYAKWVQIQYRVFLHPNVPETDTLVWGQTNQQMNFRVTIGDKVSGGEVINGERANGEYELIAWFTDPKMTNDSYFNFDAVVLNDDTVPTDPVYDKTKDYTDTMNKYGRITDSGSNSDVERNWITRKLDLYAKWRSVIVGAKGINVVYDATSEGHGEPTDSQDYLDNSTTFAQAASTPNDASKQFEGWMLMTWNGSEYVEKEPGKLYNPGDEFNVYKADAKKEARIDPETGEQMVDEDGVPQYTYTVMLRAKYKDYESPVPTHINWYSNLKTIGGDDLAKARFIKPTEAEDIDGKGWMIGQTGLQINQAVGIEPATTYSYPGAIFLGWARVDTSKTAADVTEADMFLKWDATQSKFFAKDEAGEWTIEATQVACDEKTPYHDLYALWDTGYFYVYHSSDCTVERIPMPVSSESGTFDLTQLVADNFMYGGYYKKYNRAGADFDATTAEYTDNKTTDSNGTPYVGGSGAWTKSRAYTVNGREMVPEAGKTYFLKEVPNDVFLQNYTHVIFDTRDDNTLKKIFMISSLDDTNYSTIDLYAENSFGARTKLAVSYVFGESATTEKTTIDASTFGATAGFVAVWNPKDLSPVEKGCKYIIPTYTTPDGVIVDGSKMRVVTFGDGKIDASGKIVDITTGKFSVSDTVNTETLDPELKGNLAKPRPQN